MLARRVALSAASAAAVLIAVACSGGGDGASPTVSVTPAAMGSPAPTPLAPKVEPVAFSEDVPITASGSYAFELEGNRLWKIDRGFKWSPDGRRIVVYRCCVQDGGVDIYDFATDRFTHLYTGDVFDAAWSPDGQQVGFIPQALGSPPADLYIVNGDGSGLRKLAEQTGAFTLHWSPDAQRIAFMNRSEAYAVDPRTGTKAVISASIGQFSEYGGMAWSPDGGRLLFCAGFPGGGDETVYRVYIYDFEAGSLKKLIDDACLGAGGVWSPDGSRVILHAADKILIVDSETGDRVELPKGRGLTWSPEGTQIAYVRDACSGGAWDVYVTSVDGASTRQLTASEGIYRTSPAWIPDGSAVMFGASSFDQPRGSIISVGLETGEERIILRATDAVEGPELSPDGRRILFSVGIGHGICD